MDEKRGILAGDASMEIIRVRWGLAPAWHHGQGDRSRGTTQSYRGCGAKTRGWILSAEFENLRGGLATVDTPGVPHILDAPSKVFRRSVPPTLRRPHEP